MPTVALTISIPDDYQEALIAELADLDFEAFEQEDDSMVAYIPANRWDESRRQFIESWLAGHELDVSVTEDVIGDRNWNRQWEETIEPVSVGPFLVKPTWRDVPAGYEHLTLLEIDPKMSFGTGYHASTRLMLRLMPDFVSGGERVLDAGTGTGILAIAAVKLGASSAVAFDIDPWSQTNASENILLNGVADRIAMVPGSMDDVSQEMFDVVLANINLNVILGMLDRFAGKLEFGGFLLISGVLLRDRERLLSRASEQLKLVREAQEDEWWAGALKRNNRIPSMS